MDNQVKINFDSIKVQKALRKFVSRMEEHLNEALECNSVDVSQKKALKQSKRECLELSDNLDLSSMSMSAATVEVLSKLIKQAELVEESDIKESVDLVSRFIQDKEDYFLGEDTSCNTRKEVKGWAAHNIVFYGEGELEAFAELGHSIVKQRLGV